MLLLSLLLSMTPSSLLQLHDPLLLLPACWNSDLWLVETWWLCRHSPVAHSSADLGVVLSISFTAGPISPFTNSKNCVSFASSPHFANPRASFWFRANSSASVWEGGVGARVEFLGGSLRSLFNPLIGWVPLLHQKHGSTHLQNRRKRGSRGGKACGRRSCCSKDERAGN